jgi:carbon monoxide dehydrogenase subunit G
MKLENNFTIGAPVEKAWEALNSPETVAPCFPGATLTQYEGDSFAGTVKVKLGPIAMTYKGKGTYVTRDEAAHEVVIDASGRDSRGNGTANAKVTASLAADGPDRTAVSMVTDMTITGKPAQFGRGVIADVADKIIGQFSACVARKLAPEASSAADAETAAAPVSQASAPASEAIGEAVAERSSTNGAAAPTDTAPTEATTEAVEAGAAALGTSESGTLASGTPASGTPASATPAAGTSEVEAPASTTMTAPSVATPSPTVPAPRPAARGPVRSEVEAIDLLDTAGAPVLKRLAPAAGGVLFLVLVILLVRRLRSS